MKLMKLFRRRRERDDAHKREVQRLKQEIEILKAQEGILQDIKDWQEGK